MMPSDNTNIRGPQVTAPDTAEKLDAAMRQLGIKEHEAEVASRATTLGLPHINFAGLPISPEALSTINEADVSRLQLICFFINAREAHLGSVRPTDPEVLSFIKSFEQANNVQAKVYLISEHSFDLAFRLHQNLPKLRPVVRGVEISEHDIEKFKQAIGTLDDLSRQLSEVSTTDVLTLVIAAAIKARSSDIHLETEEQIIKVRFRIDGLLHDAATMPVKSWSQVVSRIKLLAGVKINVDDRPQDGRFTIFLTHEKVDVRVSFLPTTYGESVVMRLLLSSAAGLSFEDLGIRGRAFADLEKEILKPNGMIVTTGPTGSGKTTTLYAILNKLNDSETKIITIEDPVEYKIDGINQSQINYGKGYDFANGLRSILRQDPDVVMVGEIRDLETAEIAINGAMTGHLVVSTLHTNDAAGTIPRFLAMGVKPFLLAPAINAMVGQRLVRRICQGCKQPVELDTQVLARVMRLLAEIPESSGARLAAGKNSKLVFYKGAGCEVCQGLGYKGRVGIYEIVTMNQDIEKLILSGHVSEYDMRDIAVKNGVVSMVQDGLLKALDGITTVDEVFRVAKDLSDGSDFKTEAQ